MIRRERTSTSTGADTGRPKTDRTGPSVLTSSRTPTGWVQGHSLSWATNVCLWVWVKIWVCESRCHIQNSKRITKLLLPLNTLASYWVISCFARLQFCMSMLIQQCAQLHHKNLLKSHLCWCTVYVDLTLIHALERKHIFKWLFKGIIWGQGPQFVLLNTTKTCSSMLVSYWERTASMIPLFTGDSLFFFF